jgi:hypothetical protein
MYGISRIAAGGVVARMIGLAIAPHPSRLGSRRAGAARGRAASLWNYGAQDGGVI